MWGIEESGVKETQVVHEISQRGGMLLREEGMAACELDARAVSCM